MGKRLAWLSTSVLIAVMALPSVVKAANLHDVVIGEIAWAGSSVSSADEWLELRNTTDAVIDLAGWTLWDTAKEPAEQQLLIESGQIGAGATFLIANNAADHVFGGGQSVLDVVPDLVSSSVSLSNSKLRLELRDATGGVVDTIGNGGAGFLRGVDAPSAMVRTLDPPSDGTVALSWTLAATASGIDATAPDRGTPTPSSRPSITLPTACQLNRSADGLELPVTVIVDFPPTNPEGTVTVTLNGLPALTIETVSGATRSVAVSASAELASGPYRLQVVAIGTNGLTTTNSTSCLRTRSDGIVLVHEVAADPEVEGTEFIELHNAGPLTVDLYGWVLDDIDGGGSSPYTIGYSLTLAPEATVALWKTETELALNNGGDDVELRRPSGERADLVRYDGGGAKGQSWNRGSPWYWSSPSPGRTNHEQPPIEPISQGGSTTAKTPIVLPLVQILGQREQLARETVVTEATVVSGLGEYDDRRLIIGDGDVFAELQVREGVTVSFQPGDRLQLLASLSTSQTPRLLLADVADAAVIGRADVPRLVVNDATNLQLAQHITVTGTVSRAGGSPWIMVNGRELRMSRRDDVDLPSVAIGDRVAVQGIVTDLDPLRLRVLGADGVRVLESAPLASADSPVTTEASAKSTQPEPEASSAGETAGASRTSHSDDRHSRIDGAAIELVAGQLAHLVSVLEERSKVVGTLAVLVASSSVHHSSPVSDLAYLATVSLALASLMLQGGDLIWQQLARRVNGP